MSVPSAPMDTPRKRTVAGAAGVSAALLATSSAFAVANGILGRRPNNKVGTVRVIEKKLVPAVAPIGKTPTHAAPPRVTTTAGVAPLIAGERAPGGSAKSD